MAEYNQRFDSFQEWVNKASSWLTRHPDYHDYAHSQFKAVCFDSKGRHVKNGGDFARARDEDAFPVHWLWPDQIGQVALEWVAATQDDDRYPVLPNAIAVLPDDARARFMAEAS